MVTSYLLLTGASNSQQDESIYSLDKMNYRLPKEYLCYSFDNDYNH